MAIITFLSDFGSGDHYVAAVKGVLISSNPNVQIVDISHDVTPGHIAEAAFLLKSVYKEFPEGSIHLVGVDDPYRKPTGYVAIQLEGHFFVGPDNGLFGLVSDSEEFECVQIHSSDRVSTFSTKYTTAPIAAGLAAGRALSDLGTPIEGFKRLLNRQIRANKSQIIGNVIHVDSYGNLITNIDKTTFKTLSEGRQFRIVFGAESLQRIHEGYHSVEPGDCFIVFNSLGFMEIGIKQGNAEKLLGLEYDSTIMVTFD